MSSYSFMASLLVFFIVCSKVTNWKSIVKRTFEENFKEGNIKMRSIAIILTKKLHCLELLACFK